MIEDENKNEDEKYGEWKMINGWDGSERKK